VLQQGNHNTFLENVIGELAALTPGRTSTSGGDEAQAISQPRLTSTSSNECNPSSRPPAKQAIGWEEITQSQLLPGRLPSTGISQSTRTSSTDRQAVQQDLIQAVQKGTQVIMSPADKAHLDMKSRPPHAWADLGRIYRCPGRPTLGPCQPNHRGNEQDILGVEAPLWSETLASMADREYMPFRAALASPRSVGLTSQTGLERGIRSAWPRRRASGKPWSAFLPIPGNYLANKNIL